MNYWPVLNVVILCVEFINEPAETLTPVKLAERAAEFISKQAENYADKSAVSFQIISGEALKEQG